MLPFFFDFMLLYRILYKNRAGVKSIFKIYCKIFKKILKMTVKPLITSGLIVKKYKTAPIIVPITSYPRMRPLLKYIKTADSDTDANNQNSKSKIAPGILNTRCIVLDKSNTHESAAPVSTIPKSPYTSLVTAI